MKALTISITVAIAASSSAQVLMNGGVYYQDFDSLAPTGAGNPWVDNTPTPLMKGWYSNQASYDADNGSTPISGLYSEGPSTPERALGSVALPGALIVYGVRMQNVTSNTFGSLFVDYTGEQWRDGSAPSSDVLQFQYSTNATSLGSGTWTSFNPLDFNSVSNSGLGPIDGNLPINEANPVATITGLNWLAGTDMWVRWLHVGNTSRHAMAIDNVHLQAGAVPEPATLLALGLGALGLLKRRSQCP